MQAVTDRIRLGPPPEIPESSPSFSSEQYAVRGLGRVVSRADLGAIVVDAHEGVPIYLRKIADVIVSGAPRQGAVTIDGDRETLSGMAIMLKGRTARTSSSGSRRRSRTWSARCRKACRSGRSTTSRA